MALRRADVCSACGCDLAIGVVAVWDNVARRVTCVACDGEGLAGASARAHGQRMRDAELERRHQLVERRPIVGRIEVALAGPAEAGQSWLVGAVGEEQLGGALMSLHDSGVLSIHDRGIPRSKANIDHIAICAQGAIVIDAKRYEGAIRVQDRGGLFRVDDRLVINGRDRTKLVDGVERQRFLVRAALDNAGFTAVSVMGALCFVNGDFSLFTFKPPIVKGIIVTWWKALKKQLLADGPVGPESRQAVKEALVAAFPSARAK